MKNLIKLLTVIFIASSGQVFAQVNVGDNYQGGMVAYILQVGDPGYDANVQHGLIAAPMDQSTGAVWCSREKIYKGKAFFGATETQLGTGAKNTRAILAKSGHKNSAAELCSKITINEYSDWFLPSKDELVLMFTNLLNAANSNSFNDFANDAYWSSSEQSAYEAWMQFFSKNYMTQTWEKSARQYVRCARYF